MSAGYQPLAQSDEAAPTSPTTSGSFSGRRARHPGSIDLKNIDHAFKRWTENISKRVGLRKVKVAKERQPPEIWRSVFEPTFPVQRPTYEKKTLDHLPPMSQARYDGIVTSVRTAILDGIHPKMIAKGSSGSYFARAKTEQGKVQTVAVFKPKDEEPYGRLNPKTTKWLHRKLRFIIPFGRACLIPNLSYISEAAASLLDTRLDLHIVPPTQLVSLSSQAFFYDWIDRNAAKKGKPLPEKIGSLQFFMNGFTDASDFLRKHPWPGRSIHDTFDDSTHRHVSISKRLLNTLKIICGRTGTDDQSDDMDFEEERLFDATESYETSSPFYWTPVLQESFREELEKLVILDYLMRNTDRGADNYMIKYCDAPHEKTLIDVAPAGKGKLEIPHLASPQVSATSAPTPPLNEKSDYTKVPHIHIAAIDNSLSFPHEHPKGWRSYTFGWLYLPVSVIGRPFSTATRNHFLPKLTSRAWWEETTFELEKLFALDPDFHPKMFKRQLAVIKGQAWNIVQSLKHSDEGPLELTRRTKALVWDDELEIASETMDNPFTDPLSSPRSVQLPLSRPHKSPSAGEFPPPMPRMPTDMSGTPRPVPFSQKFQRIHPGTTGVTILEHLERLDAVEASLQRLSSPEIMPEIDVGEVITPKGKGKAKAHGPRSPTGIESPLPTVQEVANDSISETSTVEEEDLVTMSKSMSHVERSPGHGKFSTEAHVGMNMDWMVANGRPQGVGKRTVIVERLETIDQKPLCSCW